MKAKGCETMTKEQVKEFELALLEFVKRASQKGAAAEEVEALPAVAKILTNLIELGLLI